MQRCLVHELGGSEGRRRLAALEEEAVQDTRGVLSPAAHDMQLSPFFLVTIAVVPHFENFTGISNWIYRIWGTVSRQYGSEERAKPLPRTRRTPPSNLTFRLKSKPLTQRSSYLPTTNSLALTSAHLCPLASLLCASALQLRPTLSSGHDGTRGKGMMPPEILE